MSPQNENILDLDLGDNKPIEKPLDGRPNIAILLGAVFSAPMGYPIGKTVNDYLAKFDFDKYDISPAGVLYERGIPENVFYSQYQRNLRFCKCIIDKYIALHEGLFDYEEFFDFIHGREIYTTPYKDCANDLIARNENYKQFVDGLENIYIQMIEQVVKDKNGKIWYDDEPSSANFPEEYASFLRILNKWSSDYIIDVHTLNHDLLFESFNKIGELAVRVSDGFEEYGSNYYGELSAYDRKYTVRLKHYSKNYSSALRLYKLHGSLDYVLYYKSDGIAMIPDTCIKRRFGVGLMSLKREVSSERRYEPYPFAYHSYFLTGVHTKIAQYYYPFYKDLHEIFHTNLKTAEKMVVIGYGGKDKGINDAILQNYDYKRKPTIIIDLKPSEQLIQFAKKLDARIITKSVSNIKEEDLS